MLNELVFRNLTRADLAAMFEIYRAENIEAHGSFALSEEDFEKDWLMNGFNPETDAFGAFLDGRLIGYAETRIFRAIPVRPNVYGHVYPEFRGKGISTCLLEWAKERARQYIPQCPPEARVVLNAFTPFEEGVQLLRDNHFVETRQSYVMAIEFDGPQPAPELPEGFRIQTMADGATTRDITWLYQETFRDHRGAIDEPLEEVQRRWEGIIAAHSDFDPAMAVCVLHGDTPAAIVVTMPTDEGDEEVGYIQTVGVMPAYRRHGLGMLLLRLAFHQLHTRGRKGAVLSVDASSLTGATRLYERAGMYIKSVFHVLEYEVRPGIEMTNQG